MEPPPPPVLHREARSGVHLGLQRGGSLFFVITYPSPSPIPWCSPPGVSNSFIGSLVGEELDEIHHVIKLVLLGPDPKCPLCSKIDVSMTFPCFMLITLGPGAMDSDLNRLCYHNYIHVLDPILQVIVTYYGYDPTTPKWQQQGPLSMMTVVWGVHVFTMC